MGVSQRISLYLTVCLKVLAWDLCFLQFYASKLFEILKRHLPDVHVYADDNQLYLSFKPGSSVSELEAVTALQNCIIDIKTWMTTDKLKLNDGKTEFIIIVTRAQLDKMNITKLSIDQVKVSAVSSVRNLGTWFDNHLTMTTAINKTCESGLYHLHNIRRIKRFLSFEDRKSIVQQQQQFILDVALAK